MIIYILRSGKSGPYRIDSCRDLEVELDRLQEGCPYKLEVIAKIQIACDREALEVAGKMRAQYWGKKIRGSWFNHDIDLSLLNNV